MKPPCPIKSFAHTLNDLSSEARRKHFESAVTESGGTYNVPNALPPGRAIVTLSLHGIQTTGWLLDDAIESWISIALGNERPPSVT